MKADGFVEGVGYRRGSTSAASSMGTPLVLLLEEWHGKGSLRDGCLARMIETPLMENQWSEQSNPDAYDRRRHY